jgi:hypothetical protein
LNRLLALLLSFAFEIHEQEGDSSKESESERILQQTLGVGFLQIQVMDVILFVLFQNIHGDIDIR